MPYHVAEEGELGNQLRYLTTEDMRNFKRSDAMKPFYDEFDLRLDRMTNSDKSGWPVEKHAAHFVVKAVSYSMDNNGPWAIIANIRREVEDSLAIMNYILDMSYSLELCNKEELTTAMLAGFGRREDAEIEAYSEKKEAGPAMNDDQFEAETAGI